MGGRGRAEGAALGRLRGAAKRGRAELRRRAERQREQHGEQRDDGGSGAEGRDGGEDEDGEGDPVEYGGGRVGIVGGSAVVCPIPFGVEGGFQCQFLKHPNRRY